MVAAVETGDRHADRRLVEGVSQGSRNRLSPERSSAGAGRTARLRAACPYATVRATRYATPLREGGSLPGVVEADDDGMYVVKFRGAGQGVKALVAEIIVGELARAVGLNVPEIVLVDVDPVLGAGGARPRDPGADRGLGGLNVGLDFLPGALAYDSGVRGLARAGRPDRLARRADAEHRPHAAQPEPARLARAAVADRPRRRAVPAPRRRHRSRGAPASSAQIADHVLAPIAGARPHPSFDAEKIVSLVPPDWLDVPAASYVSFLDDRAAFLA